MPLADELRPKNIDEFVGQKHLIGKGKILSSIINNTDNFLPSIIFYGPPGIGKTTLAEILSIHTERNFYKINASTSSISEVKEILNQSTNILNSSLGGIVLYVDEIQKFNKNQQQVLLENVEKGHITLIASTTENPYHYIHKAILSRSIILELKPLNISDISQGLKRAVLHLESKNNNKISIDKDTLNYISSISNGDMRKALNLLEIIYYSLKISNQDLINITKENIKGLNLYQTYNMDKDGDYHYNIISAFQKSIRGSDIQASLYYLSLLIESKDLEIICRRLLVIASEDIGMAYPNAISIVKSCVDTARELGFPECRFSLAQATILLASSPKSNSIHIAIDKALEAVKSNPQEDIPNHLKDSHYYGAEKLNRGTSYKYPHDYPNSYVKQQYLPNNRLNDIYYTPKNNKFENNINLFINSLK